MRTQSVLSALAIASILVLAAVPVIDNVRFRRSPAGQARLEFSRNYRRLSLGMPMRDVVTIMGRPPDYEFSCHSCYVAYYAPPPAQMIKTAKIADYRPGLSVEKLTDLPDLYDHVQLAFSSNQALIAYAWIGESYTVKVSNQKPVKGSHFSALEKAGLDIK